MCFVDLKEGLQESELLLYVIWSLSGKSESRLGIKLKQLRGCQTLTVVCLLSIPV